MFALLDTNNICYGSTSKDNGKRPAYKAVGLRWTGTKWVDPKTLAMHKAEAVERIASEAFIRIDKLAWMHNRAARHSALDKTEKKSKLEVYQMEQDIEDASDEAVVAVNKLTTIKAVKAFTW